MFKEMRRKDKAMTHEACEELLLKANYGVLGTISENGYPYLTPLNYVYLNNKIYLHSAKMGEKLKNIESNNKVSFCVVDDVKILSQKFDTDYKSVIILGKASEIQGEEKKEALRALIDKYSAEFTEEGYKYVERSEMTTTVIGIKIEHLSGKFQDFAGSKA